MENFNVKNYIKLAEEIISRKGYFEEGQAALIPKSKISKASFI